MTEMPRYNPESATLPPTRQAPTAPPIMNTIFFLLLGAALLQIIATIVGVNATNSGSYREEALKQLEAQNVTNITPEMLDNIMLVTVGTLIVMAVVSVIVYVLLALFLKMGMGWARIAAAVLAVLSLSLLIGLQMPSGLLTIVQILLGIAAAVLCFTGAAAVYFREKKDYKLANKVH